VAKALGDKQGITRYAGVHLPMDETLTRVAVDVSGRPYLIWKVAFPTPEDRRHGHRAVPRVVPGLRSERRHHLHIETLYGDNSHHIAETCFKGLARALRAAIAIDPAPSGAGALDEGDAVARAMLETDAAPAKRKPRVGRCMTQSPTGVFTAAAIAEIFA
jgi:imidazoleglycerol phosphate dehydratase HisB